MARGGILAHRQAGYIPAVFLQAIIISSLANRVEPIYTLARSTTPRAAPKLTRQGIDIDYAE